MEDKVLLRSSAGDLIHSHVKPDGRGDPWKLTLVLQRKWTPNRWENHSV